MKTLLATMVGLTMMIVARAESRAECPVEHPPSPYQAGGVLTQKPTLERESSVAVRGGYGRFGVPGAPTADLATAEVNGWVSPHDHVQLGVRVPFVRETNGLEGSALGNIAGSLRLAFATTGLAGFYRQVLGLSGSYAFSHDREGAQRVADEAALAYPFDRALYINASTSELAFDARWEVVGCHAPFFQLRGAWDYYDVIGGDDNQALRMAAAVGVSPVEGVTLIAEYLLLVGLDFTPVGQQHAISEFDLGARIEPWRFLVWSLWFGLPVDGVEGTSVHTELGVRF